MTVDELAMILQQKQKEGKGNFVICCGGGVFGEISADHIVENRFGKCTPNELWLGILPRED